MEPAEHEPEVGNSPRERPSLCSDLQKLSGFALPPAPEFRPAPSHFVFQNGPEIYSRNYLERKSGQANLSHKIYYEELGNPEGIPVLALHGGPATMFEPGVLNFFNGEKFRVITFHQRGTGSSLPLGECAENNTGLLLDDMEALRQELGINSWHVFGYSWGAALGVAYIEQFPESAQSFTGFGAGLMNSEDEAYYLELMRRDRPEQFEVIMEVSPPEKYSHFSDGFYAAIDTSVESEAARLWYKLSPEQPVTAELLARFRVNLHYVHNRYFLNENQLLNEAGQAGDLPATFIHGSFDEYLPLELTRRLADAFKVGHLVELPVSHSLAQREVQQLLKSHFDAIES